MAKRFEDLEVYQLSEQLAAAIWGLVVGWESFAKYRVGGQLVEAADSIGANIAEGSGRGSFKQNCRFARISRGSLLETRHFLRPAFRTKLLTEAHIAQLRPLMTQLSPCLCGYLRSLASIDRKSKEPPNVEYPIFERLEHESLHLRPGDRFLPNSSRP